jgi:predicted DNA-binding transcriptional regulator AlpA
VTATLAHSKDAPLPDDRLFDANELADFLHCSRRHVERMDSAGKLPAGIKLSKLKRWRSWEIRAWLDAGAPERRIWDTMKKGLKLR